MIFSMTGYTIKSQTILEDIITIEIRSLNSKYFDFSLKCPETFSFLEEKLKQKIKKKLKRGKIEIRIKKSSEKDTHDFLQTTELRKKMNGLKKIAPRISEEKSLELAILLQKKNDKKARKLTNKYQKRFFVFLDEAIDEVVNFRLKEGKALYKELAKYIKSITIQLEQIKKRDKKRLKIKKQTLRNKLESMIEKYDKTRLEQEMIYYIEKLDISEEVIRLIHHKTYFSELIYSQNEVGKKINFLVQEMLREVNTIGSKSNDFELQKNVIVIKDELEKIKEQIQNVL